MRRMEGRIWLRRIRLRRIRLRRMKRRIRLRRMERRISLGRKERIRLRIMKREKDKIEKGGSRRIRLRRIRLRRMEGRIRLEEKDEENDIDINYREGIRQNRFI